MNADVPPLLAAEPAPAPLLLLLLLLGIHLDMLELPRIEIPGMPRIFFGVPGVPPERNSPPAVPDPRNPGPESELSKV